MKAVGYRKSLPIDDAEALTDVTVERPEPKDRDLRVAVKAVSVNPVDTKVRRRAAPQPFTCSICRYAWGAACRASTAS